MAGTLKTTYAPYPETVALLKTCPLLFDASIESRPTIVLLFYCTANSVTSIGRLVTESMYAGMADIVNNLTN